MVDKLQSLPIVKDCKGTLYKTDLLDNPKYQNGTMKLFYESDDRKLYFIETTESKYVFKVIKCKTNDIFSIQSIKKEFEIAEKMYAANKAITPEPLGMRTFEKKSKKRIYFEMLFPYCGVSLYQAIFSADAQDILLVAIKTADVFMEMHKANIFHSDIKPSNIVRQENTLMAIDFGVSLAFEQFADLIKTVHTTERGFRGWTRIYVPPENLRNTKVYKHDKFDVYCWGMTIYQYATHKINEQLQMEVEAYKINPGLYPKFLELLDDISFMNDKDDRIKNFLIPILKLALAENPDDRPSFADIKARLSAGIGLLVPDRTEKLSYENKQLKEELVKMAAENKSMKNSMLYEQEERKKLGEINETLCAKMIEEAKKSSGCLKVKEQELAETLNTLTVKSKECESLKNENKNLKKNLTNAQDLLKATEREIGKLKDKLMKNYNYNSIVNVVDENYHKTDPKSFQKITSLETNLKLHDPSNNLLEEDKEYAVVKVNDNTLIKCNCSTKMNIKLKCSHMICFACMTNITKNVRIKWKNVKCGKCNALFEIGIFAYIKINR